MHEALLNEFSFPLDWYNELSPEEIINLLDVLKELKILHVAHPSSIFPEKENIFKALRLCPLATLKVVILGQDPYPTKGHAHGLAFSVDSSVSPLPASLRNIYKELNEDLGITRSDGDLSNWVNQGVMLINRVLTTEVGQSMAHDSLGWQAVTETVAQILGERDVIAVLWGNSALQLKKYFPEESVVASVHPSPLSAYRGFFGSQPFSQVNTKLALKGLPAVVWQ